MSIIKYMKFYSINRLTHKQLRVGVAIQTFNILDYFAALAMMLMLVFSPSANASETPAPIAAKLYYEASFLGLNIGKAGIELSEKPEAANVTCEISTAGILGLFLKHSSHTTLSASGMEFSYPNKKYESHYQTRNKKRAVWMEYKDGKIASKTLEPKESADKRPAIPDEQINSAYDLMSFLLKMRGELFNALKDGKTKFSIDAYDGRRLTQVDFTILGNKTIKIDGKKYITTVVSARRTYKAGYSKSEMADYDPSEPSMTLYFSKDAKLMPLRFEIPYIIGTLTTDLTKECADTESCLLGISE